MSPSPVFLLDSNVFIESAKRYYAFGIAPGYWDGLLLHASRGPIRSIDKVKIEIDRGNDDLKTWVDSHFHGWFESTDQQDVTDAYRQVITHALNQERYTDAAKSDFARAADGWVIAHALAKRFIVVTDEQFDPNIRKKIKIPNICRELSVSYINTFEMLHALHVQLILPRS
jgi:hypothetical protein